MNDTITAISSGGKINQAISIIRISGDQAFAVISKIFSGKIGKNREVTFGNIIDNFHNNTIVDEVLVAWFYGPNTFTGENTVEINCHGGVVVTNQILKLVLANGARLALPGEFSQRSFLNGKMDLIKAQAINDLIHAQTERQTQLALKKFSGVVSQMINSLMKDLMYLIGAIEVNIDYPEYDDVENALGSELLLKLKAFDEKVSVILDKSQTGRLIFEGVKVAILGQPNVGKSSILNCLLEEEKAIVTDEAGTTRDVIEATYQIDGFLFKLIDTAGLRETTQKIEKLGIEKSLDQIAKADIVVHIQQPNAPANQFDAKIIETCQQLHKKRIAVINKSDLLPANFVQEADKIYVSALTQNITDLKNALVNAFDLNSFAESEVISSAREIALIQQAQQNIRDAITTLKNGLDADLTIVDIRRAWANLADISGRADNEDLLDEMFRNFCLGK
ncbi:tRNA uridine-5-carboxymethylaminomethyl(34) synthesis GTPase MnmE [Mycoplasmopsis columbinasalis]|uniref:tRNA modification GTPase MnmE n=1 Tax=Mycoplasmopsis columbinasalis TaxID=114880 RepID=A0A449B9U7_9BACT|nr:tRNA uridine-5-carboxymethylaminomethyl(34) synthesis GTPase MnmE [Mycoplasmopsis columbinasalis]VEU77959.1 tRNA modification GTPase TrmE [Mycoplasmopsis columbinasalis]